MHDTIPIVFAGTPTPGAAVARARRRPPASRGAAVGLGLAAVVGAAAIATPAGATRSPGSLVGTVGPGFAIALENAHGKPVTRLRSGRYRLAIHDRSAFLDFHLFGPGVDKRTTVTGTGTVRWLLRLRRGVYHYQCDAHQTILSGAFRVG
jgi:hypothetical protein